jgi:NADPH:quinone reductase-like Zn-dependent oxidoreductase
MSATDGKGIDVILAGPDVSHHASIWSCLARNGKFVLTGGAEVPDMGIFDMSVFSRGATFSSFDLLDMIGVDPMQTATLMREILKFHRDGQLWPLRAAEIFDIAELGSAVKMVSRGTCFGKVLLSCGQESIVPVSLFVYDRPRSSLTDISNSDPTCMESIEI